MLTAVSLASLAGRGPALVAVWIEARIQSFSVVSGNGCFDWPRYLNYLQVITRGKEHPFIPIDSDDPVKKDQLRSARCLRAADQV